MSFLSFSETQFIDLRNDRNEHVDEPLLIKLQKRMGECYGSTPSVLDL